MVKTKKCSFLCTEVSYLGHISVEGVCPDPKKLEVRSFPVPCDVTQVRQFLGLASYYRRFVPRFAMIASPLHALLKKDNAFLWSPECSSDFKRLKDVLTSSPVLVFFPSLALNVNLFWRRMLAILEWEQFFSSSRKVVVFILLLMH